MSMSNFILKITIILFVLLVVIGVAFMVKKNIGPISIPRTDDTVKKAAPHDAITPHLAVPKGFIIRIFADNVPGARMLAFDPIGRLLVSQTKEGSISLIEDANHNGIADTRKTLAENLDKPHGLAFDCPTHTSRSSCFLYVAEHGRLGRYIYDTQQASISSYEKLLDLESSLTGHFTRTLLFLPPPNNHILLVSVGSSCNVCHEKGNMRAKIMAYNTHTRVLTEYAKGLRNAVFMTLDPSDGNVFVTEMGRDGLGDDMPPDEINRIEQGKNYGWPNCYGKNIHDTAFDTNIYIRNPCMEPFEMPSLIDLQAHSAPLGLSFIPTQGWPEEYKHNLLVAFHGSWNRTNPTGYKIVRLRFDAQKKYLGMEDFITGWLTPRGTKLGRPADITILPDGVLYISDDSSGVIYRMAKEQ